MKDRDCDWPFTHDRHQWEYKGEVLQCSGEPVPLEHPIPSDTPARPQRRRLIRRTRAWG